MNLNQVIIIGRTTAKPETKATNSGTSITSLTVVTNRVWNQNGEKQEEAEFHNVVAFGKLAEIIGQYVQKGQIIMIQGRINTRSWEKDGQKRYTTEIVAEQMQMGPRPQGSQREDKVDIDDVADSI